MSFVVRQISKRTDGGDITRTSRFETAEITVGRGTDCDIQLADLGVMLRHARLSLLDGGRVAVEATGGIPLEIGGRFLNRAELDVSQTPAIEIASHRLTLSRAPAPGGIAITVERVIAAAETADAASETSIFSLQKVLPSQRIMAWGLVIFILAVGLAAPLWLMAGRNPVLAAAPKTRLQPDIVWTSGPLSIAHAGLSNNCGACHQRAFVSVTDSACIACHTAADTPAHAAPARMAQGRIVATGIVAGIHKRLNLPEGRCAGCHTEHEGPRGALMVAENFCTDCHAGLSSRLPGTALANVAGWDAHPQFKPAIVRTPSLTAPQFVRVSLAARPRENSGLTYPHQLHLSATNSVANMVRKQALPGQGGALACNYCHTPDSDRVRFKPIAMERNCAACHDLAFARDGSVVRRLPHGQPEQVAGIIRDFTLNQAIAPRAGVERIGFERRQPGQMAAFRTAGLKPAGADAAIASIFAKGGVCADCHAVIDTGAADSARRFAIAPVTLADHYLAKGRFPHGKHLTYDGKTGDAACIACHKGVTTSKLSADVLLPPVSQCRDCHGVAKVATNAPATCATCHGYHYGDGGHGGDVGVGAGRASRAERRTPSPGLLRSVSSARSRGS